MNNLLVTSLSDAADVLPVKLNALGSVALLAANVVSPDWKIVLVQGVMTLASVYMTHALRSSRRTPRLEKKPPSLDGKKSPDNGANEK